jgi:hypothetical protein
MHSQPQLIGAHRCLSALDLAKDIAVNRLESGTTIITLAPPEMLVALLSLSLSLSLSLCATAGVGNE